MIPDPVLLIPMILGGIACVILTIMKLGDTDMVPNKVFYPLWVIIPIIFAWYFVSSNAMVPRIETYKIKWAEDKTLQYIVRKNGTIVNVTAMFGKIFPDTCTVQYKIYNGQSAYGVTCEGSRDVIEVIEDKPKE